MSDLQAKRDLVAESRHTIEREALLRERSRQLDDAIADLETVRKERDALKAAHETTRRRQPGILQRMAQEEELNRRMEECRKGGHMAQIGTLTDKLSRTESQLQFAEDALEDICGYGGNENGHIRAEAYFATKRSLAERRRKELDASTFSSVND